MKYELGISIRDYYTETFPDDDLGPELLNISFNDLLVELVRRRDIYDVIHVGDSLVRERLFDKLANILQVPYIFIYDIWMLPEDED